MQQTDTPTSSLVASLRAESLIDAVLESKSGHRASQQSSQYHEGLKARERLSNHAISIASLKNELPRS